MKKERFEIRVLVDYKIDHYLICGQPFVRDEKFKILSVHYLTNQNWKRRAQMVYNQIVKQVGSKEFEVLNHKFIFSTTRRAGDENKFYHQTHGYQNAKKLEALLLWSKGETSKESAWIKANRTSEALIVKSRSQVVDFW